MSMPSFRDALNKVSTQHNPAAARHAPAAAPSFLSDLAERVESTQETVSEQASILTPVTARVLPFQPSSEPIEPAKTTGFNSMLQRIAGQQGAKVVSVLGETAPSPAVQAPVAPGTTPASLDEGLLSGLIAKHHPGGDEAVGQGVLQKHHHEAYDQLHAAHEALIKAHATIGRAHELATDPVHKEHLKQQSLHVAMLYQGVTNAKAANNFSIQHYMGGVRKD